MVVGQWDVARSHFLADRSFYSNSNFGQSRAGVGWVSQLLESFPGNDSNSRRCVEVFVKLDVAATFTKPPLKKEYGVWTRKVVLTAANEAQKPSAKAKRKMCIEPPPPPCTVCRNHLSVLP